MSGSAQRQPDMITDAAGLDALCRVVDRIGWFAFDTEFVGEDQYSPEVCLIQVATEGIDALVDPLVPVDTTPLWERIADERVRVIVHAGGEDIAQCWIRLGQPPRNIFDIQIAAGIVGLGYPISLGRLAKTTIGRTIHKAHTLSDWRKRPLSQEQIRYAVEDVIYLRSIHDHMLERIETLGRGDWIQEECDALCSHVCTTENGSKTLKRLKGAGSLKPRELAVAHALLAVRDEIAAEYNRPARALLRDHLLVEIARRGWTDAKRILSLRGIQLRAVSARRLAEVVEEAKKLPPESWPKLSTQEDSPQEEVLLSFFSAVLREYCNQNHLSYSLLCKKQNLRDLLRHHTRPNGSEIEHVFSNGWRKTAVGDLISDLLAGKRTVRVRAGGKDSGLTLE